MTSSTYERAATGSAILDDGRIRELLGSSWGIEPTALAPLPGEIDRNVVVHTPDETYVLKVSGALTPPPEVDLQCALLEHLASAGPDLAVPRLVRTVDGQPTVRVETAAGAHVARLVTWVPGTVIASLRHRPPGLLRSWGRTAARLVELLSDFDHPAARRTHLWDYHSAARTVRECLPYVPDPTARGHLDDIVTMYDAVTATRLGALPASVVHHDLNDVNVLAGQDASGAWRVSGVLDVGDALHAPRVAELATAVAYAMRDQPDPLAVAGTVVAAFHAELPLTDDELAVVLPMALVRLALNATTWSRRLADNPANEYAMARMRSTYPTLALLHDVTPEHAEAVARAAVGALAPRRRQDVLDWLAAASPAPVIAADAITSVDLGIGSDAFDDPAADVSSVVGAALAGASVAVSAYGTARHDRAARRRTGVDEPATVQLGTELFAVAGTPVHAPLDATVGAIDGNTIELCHRTADDTPFWTLLRGVDTTLSTGDEVAAGAPVGTIAGAALPSVTVQLACWRPRAAQAAPVFAAPSQQHLWQLVCPDPASLLPGIPATPGYGGLTVDDVTAMRGKHFARSQRSYYDRPMNLVRARGLWFSDDQALQYLDAVNNVTHLGHGHPRVVEAAYRQLRRLNTNSRFVYAELAEYADRLAAALPGALDVVFLVCSGSEANDLALRIARQTTGREDVCVIDGAYHGNTTAVTGISPNRYKGPGGTGAPPTTHEFPMPDRYQGPFGYAHPDPGQAYAAAARDVLDSCVSAGRAPAAFIAESLMGTAGQIVHPDGYLARTFADVRAAGGLCIADEVQVGFGRLGHGFWGFELAGVVPDIVTMGKPIGNGFPLAAVATTREIAEAFDTGMRYFNTFGGNPVACAVGMAVLDVIEQEGLQQRALEVGGWLQENLRALMDRHELIGDVRGEGLYVGIELVTDRGTKAPARGAAYAISERMKDEGVIVYPNGVRDNVLKVKPPMVATIDDVAVFVNTLDEVLSTGW